MKNFSELASKYFETVPDFVRRRRVIILLLFIGITVFAILGLPRLKFDLTTEGWFRYDDPVKVALDDFKAQFGSDDGIYIVYKPKDGDLFSAKSLEAAKALCEDIINARAKIQENEKSPLGHITRITSLTNAKYLDVDEDMLLPRTLVGKTVPTSQQKLDSIRKVAQSQKNLQLAYYSKDLMYGGISIETDFGVIPMDFEEPANDGLTSDGGMMTMETDKKSTNEKIRFKPTDTKDYYALMTIINTFLNNPKYADHLEFYPVGNAVQSIYDAKSMAVLSLLYLVALSIMVLLLWIIFRSLSAVVSAILIIIFATIWTVGISGWLGFTATFYMMLTIMMLLTMSMTDVIHLMTEYIYCRNENLDHQTSLRITYEKVALPSALTTFTTVIGFVALSFSPIVHIKVFGYMTVAGLVLQLIFAIYILPLMLDMWPPVRKVARTKKELSDRIARIIPNFSHILQRRIEAIVPFAEKRSIIITVFFTIILGLCVLGASKVKVSFDMMDQYEKTSLIRKSYEKMDEHMGGSQNMEIFLNMGKEYAFQDPFVLTNIEKLQKVIEKKYSNYVVRTSSLADIVKDANQKLNEGREDMYIIPKNSETVSQTLFMFNNANPVDRRSLVSDDYSQSHISVSFRNSDAATYQGIFDDIQKDIDATVSILKEKYTDTKVILTGTLAMMMKASVYVSQSTGGSLAFAILAITLTLLVVFGSFKLGWIAIVPNLIPSILPYSVLGFFNIPLDMNTLLIGPIIIGVAADDTVHFISHYRSELAVHGDSIRALKTAVNEAGQAVIFGTLVLGLGFTALAFAPGPISYSGKLGALAIFSGLICELLLLPSMILLFDRHKGSKSVQPEKKLHENPVLEEVLDK